MERGRSFSGGWNHSDRARPPRIATVKPVSKSFSEDDLMKVVGDKQNISPRVFNRLKIQDLTTLKKDNLISELEKCLGELEEEHDTTNKLSEVYEKVESERNQLLDELDVAFQDLQEYMQKQKMMEDQTNVIETDRDELIRENEYLKAVLSNRTEIHDSKLDEENRTLLERVKELEGKNTQLVDEINDLYEDRQTLISSLLNLRSEEVEDVIKRSRNSSLASRDSSSDAERLRMLSDGMDDQIKDLEVFFSKDGQDEIHEACSKTISELNAERYELKEAFKRAKKERDGTEKELDQTREDKDKLEKVYMEKIQEFNQLVEERNEKNLNLSELKLEKRTLQRQLDHMRETNRTLASKVDVLKEEGEDLKASLSALGAQLAGDDLQMEEMERTKKELNVLYEAKAEMENETGMMEQTLRTQEESISELETQKVKLLEQLENIKMENDNLKKSKEEQKIVLEKQKEERKIVLEKQKMDNEKTSKELLDLQKCFKLEREKSSTVQVESAKLRQQVFELSNEAQVSDKQSKNRINTLEIEVTKGTAAKETVDKMLRRREQELKDCKREIEDVQKQYRLKEEENENGKAYTHASKEVLSAVNRKCDTLNIENQKTAQKYKQLQHNLDNHKTELQLVKDSKNSLVQKNQNLEGELANIRNNLNSSKIENDRLTKKIRQFDKIVSENVNLHDELNHLKATNEVLSKRLESSQLESNKYEKEAKSLSDILVLLRVESKHLKDTNEDLSQRIHSFESDDRKPSKTKEEERERYSLLLMKYDTSCQQLEKVTELQKTSTNENKMLKKQQSDTEGKLLSLRKDFDLLKESKQKMEQDVQYILQSRKEEAETVFSNKRNKIEHERDTVKAKYELLRVDCDRMNKEKDHYIMTIDTLREENGKLHDQIRKQRLISSSTQDLVMQRLRGENDRLESQVEILQSSVAKCNAEKKELQNKIGRSDESMVTTIRSLKARKNELQIQVNTLLHEKEHLAKRLNDTKEAPGHQDSPVNKRKMFELEVSESDLNEKLINAYVRVAELEADNGDYGKKLEESESLLYDLQQALAQANDLAMQKSLEASKLRRNLELKYDRLLQENTELKRTVYFTGNSNGEISPTSLFPRSTTTSFRDSTDGGKTRKASLPASIQNESLGSRRSKLHSGINSQSHEYPILDALPETKSSFARRKSTTSSQVEFDLSQQLRELLDLTNDLTKTDDDDEKGQVSSDESIAPPIPPLPVNYDTIDRKMLNNVNDKTVNVAGGVDRKKEEDWV